MKQIPRVVEALALSVVLAAVPARAQVEKGSRNKPERLEWFRDLGFGMFIHWSVDAPLGGVISHSLVGADADYARRFFEELPRSFNPRKFHPDDWAELAKLAGMKYVVFTTKHHAGFCMYDTKTTPFSVMKTPFRRDITREIVDAFRRKGIAIGFYFSPDDFFYLHKAGRTMARAPHAGVTPQEIPGLLAYDQAQLKELMTGYGPIDVVFLDGPAEGLREVVWDVQPNAVVTRGAIETPEQRLPGVPLDRPWESCITMGTEWPYKPAHEQYKSGTQLIEMLIETRAKGGNLLLNVGPRPDGELPTEQEQRLQQIALWNFTLDRLDFQPDGKTRVARLDLSVAATGRDNGQSWRADQRVEVRADEGKAAGWRGWARELDLPTGVAQARIVVRDTKSGALGSVTHRFEVPSPDVLRLATPILTNRLDPASPADRPRPALAVHRVFPPEGQLFGQIEVLGAAREGGRGAPRVSAGLELRAADGRVLRKAAATPIAPDRDGRLVRMMGIGLDGLPEGAYELVLQVHDEIAGRRIEQREAFSLSRPLAAGMMQP